MKRTPIAAALTLAVLALTGCAQGEPQTAETVTATSTTTVTATPSASAADDGGKVQRTSIWVMFKWEPAPGTDNKWRPGYISTAIDGEPVDVRIPVMYPTTVTGDYYRRPFMLEPGHSLSVIGGIDGTEQGEMSCLIYDATSGEELVLEEGGNFGTASCNYEMPQ